MLIGKVVGAAKEVALAYRFGIGETVDIYILAFSFAVWLPVMATTILNNIYVPLVHKLEEAERQEFRSQFIGIGFVSAAVVSISMLFLLPWVTQFLAESYSIVAQSGLLKLAYAFSFLTGLGVLSAVFSAVLLAEEKHANTLFEVIPSASLIVFILCWPIDNSVDSLMWGTLVGVALQAFGLWVLLKVSMLPIAPSVAMSSSGWDAFRKNIGIVFLGQFVMSFVDPIGNVIASDLGSGGVSSLGYSSRILMLILTVGASAVSRALLPVLSMHSNDVRQQVRIGVQWAVLMFGCGILAAIVVWLASPKLVEILLLRGAFTESDTQLVSDAIRLGVYQFPFYFSGIVLVQLFISLARYHLIFVSSVLAVITKVFFSLLLVPTFDFAGIVLASVPMYMATNLFFIGCIYRQYGNAKIFQEL